MRWRAEKLNTKGLALEEKGWSREAELAYMRATKTDPHWSVPWFNLGLLAKRQRRWPESLEWNRRATGINADDEGAWWNMGIAATALGDWDEARRAWAGFGLEIPAGRGPIELDMGLTPIKALGYSSFPRTGIAQW